MIIGNQHSMRASLDESINEQLNIGLALSEQADRVLFEDKNSKIKITMGKMMEGDDIKDPWKRASLAIMLENTRQYFANMPEATRLVNVGDFQKYAFNMVRALFPSLAAHELASVQPMAGPVSLVFFMKFIYNKTKGSAIAGQDVIENPNESYSSEVIDSEVVGTGDGATAHYTGFLAFTPIKPGTVNFTAVAGATTLTVTDDGNGNLSGNLTGGTHTINYVTGAFDFTWSANVDTGENVAVSYSYAMEANDNLPDIDLTLTSAPVTAITRKLRTRWSVEAMQDLKNLHGLDAEVEQVAAITSELKFEIDREVIRDIKNIAATTTSPWSQAPASGISFTEHKLLFVNKIVEGSNAIFKSTQRAVATWMLAGVDVASIVETLPGFVSQGKPANTRGVYKTGRLNGQWDVWKDPTYPGATKNSVDPAGYLLGYKGISMWEVGYIFAPYILAFTTPTVMLDDFLGRKAIASRYGKKAIEGKFFAKGSVSGSMF